MRQIPPPPASRLRELPPGAAPYQSRGAAHNAGQGMGGEGGMGQGMPDIFPRGGQNSGRQGPMGSMGQGMGNMGQGMNQSMSGMNQGMGGMGQGTEGDMGGMVPPGFRRIAGDIVARFRHPNDQNNVSVQPRAYVLLPHPSLQKQTLSTILSLCFNTLNTARGSRSWPVPGQLVG